MATIEAKAFTLESTLDLAADAFTVDVPGTQEYRNAADTDVVTLKAGFIDAADGEHYEVGHMVGAAKEYVITVVRDAMTCSVNGRDNAADLIGRTFRKRYLRTQPTPEEQAALDGHTFADAPDPIAFAVGAFRASEIAKEIVESCGLALSWECRDYTVLEDFDASGRCVDLLRRLVEPWSQVERFRVDLFIQNATVFCRPRAAVLVADYTYPYTAAGIKSLTIRRTRGKRYGRVTLYGKLVPKGLTGGGGVYQPSEVEETTVSETTDRAGSVLQRVIRITTYRMPEKIVLRSREQTFDRQTIVDDAKNILSLGLKLVKDEQRENEWETISYTEAGATKNPRQLRQTTIVSGTKTPKGKNVPFQVVAKETVAYSYDAEQYQDLTSTRKWELKVTLISKVPEQYSFKLEEHERVTRALKEVGNLETEEVTSVYKAGTSGEFYLAQQDTVKSAGLRPAGPRPGRTIVLGGGDTGTKEPLTVEARISDHVWADDVQYSNPNLEQEDLDVILQQLTAASGHWEYELSLDYVAMPWLRKGNVIAITGLLAEDGVTEIPIGPAVITSQRLVYDEGSSTPQMISRLTAVWWG